MKIYTLLFTSILTLISSALFAQDRVTLKVDYDMFFDNTECSQTKYSTRPHDYEGLGTEFAGKLSTSFELAWDEQNSLNIGADFLNNFGSNSEKFFEEIAPIIYYRYESPNIQAAAGIFPRELMHLETYSTAFFTHSHNFFNNLMGGVLGQYNQGESFIELACDWESQYSVESREIFRILSAARRTYDHVYYGYNFSMLHFAGQMESEFNNVVDNIMFNPCVGTTFGNDLRADIKLGAITTMQRDREFLGEWEFPMMGELAVDLKYHNFYLNESLYLGDNINPYFEGHTLESGTYMPYGRGLYPNESFFRTDSGVYNRAAVGYAKAFFEETLDLECEVATHYDGYGFGTQYLIKLGVRLDKDIYKSKNK